MQTELSAQAIDFFQRQMAAMQRALDDYAGFGGVLEEADLPALDDCLRRHTAVIDDLCREYEQLAQEWQWAVHIPQEARATVSALAREAEILVKRVDVVQRELHGQVNRRMGVVLGQLDGMRRERGLARSFQQSLVFDAGFIDKKA